MTCSCRRTRAASVATVSSGRTGTAACAMIGPWSSCAVTKCTVQPCTLTPAPRARACVSRPGNEGNSDGWILTRRPSYRRTNAAVRTRMKPASATSLGAWRSISSASAASKASRDAKSRCATVRVATRHSRAIASPAASATLLTTAETGSPASSNACMLLPRPEMRTTIDMAGRSVAARYSRKSCQNPSWTGSRHVPRAHPAIEVLRADVAEGERGLAQRGALAVRLLGDFRGAVVADHRRERSDEHERALDQLRDTVLVRLNAAHAVLLERRASVGQQAGALQEVVDQHGLEHVQLEISRGSGKIDRDVVTEHLGAQHGQRLGLRRIDLTGHD